MNAIIVVLLVLFATFVGRSYAHREDKDKLIEICRANYEDYNNLMEQLKILSEYNEHYRAYLLSERDIINDILIILTNDLTEEQLEIVKETLLKMKQTREKTYGKK